MLDRSSKKRQPEDVDQVAKSALKQATGKDESEKDPAAVALGRKGGLKGGVARAKKLSKKRRTEIAKKAAKARWSRTPE